MPLPLPLCVSAGAMLTASRRACTHRKIKAPHGVGYPECVTCDYRIEPAEDRWIRHRVPCGHRGAEIRRPCCGCVVYACGLHGECSPQKNKVGVRDCLTCSDYLCGPEG